MFQNRNWCENPPLQKRRLWNPTGQWMKKGYPGTIKMLSYCLIEQSALKPPASNADGKHTDASQREKNQVIWFPDLHCKNTSYKNPAWKERKTLKPHWKIKERRLLRNNSKNILGWEKSLKPHRAKKGMVWKQLKRYHTAWLSKEHMKTHASKLEKS